MEYIYGKSWTPIVVVFVQVQVLVVIVVVKLVGRVFSVRRRGVEQRERMVLLFYLYFVRRVLLYCIRVYNINTFVALLGIAQWSMRYSVGAYYDTATHLL